MSIADVARARGVPVTHDLASPSWCLLGLATAVSIQVVGALLVLSLLVTPAAAAMRVTASPLLTPLLSVVFAVVSVVGGILLALGGGLPISPVRHHDLVPHLRRLPHHRLAPVEARLE